MPRRKPVFASAEQKLFNDWASPDFSAELPISSQKRPQTELH